MANVAFKRGLASALAAEGFTAADGVFYLTTDTHRLYVGQDSNLIELNRYVKVVATTKDLPANPAKDDFAFVTAGNMLLVCKDPAAEGTSKWTQINAQTVDTNTDTTIAVKGTPTVTSDSSGVTVKFVFSQTETNKKNNATTAKSDISVSFKIASSDIATANSIAVAIGSKAVSGGSTISVSGAGSAASSVTLKQGSNVSISDDGKNNITISAVDTKYTLSAATNSINLKTGSTDAGHVNVAGDGAYITATADATDGLKVVHTTYADLTATTAAAQTLAHGGSFTVVTGVARDTGGHVTGYTTKQFTLPSDSDHRNKSMTIAAADKGNLKVSITDSSNQTISATTAADENGYGPMYLTVNGAKIYNQGSIEFYTKSQIDEKINGINAMVYKGTVGGTSATVSTLPTTGVSVGDTYMVALAGTYGSHSCDVGDLLIATGTETNGIITGTITWTYVPSGDDTDTQYDFGNNSSTTISLTPKGTSTATGSVQIAAGTAMSTTGSAGKITIGHANVASTATPGAAVTGWAGKFNAITGITVNAQGHVTGYTTSAITMPSAPNVSHTLTVGKDHAITLKGPSSTYSVSLVAGSSITLTDNAADSKITIGHAAYDTALAGTAQTGTTLAHGGKFTVVTGVSRDATGHVAGYTTKEYTLPGDNNTQYELAGNATVTSGVASIYNTIKVKGTQTTSGSSTTKIKSGSLTISAPETNTLNIDLVWGSF